MTCFFAFAALTSVAQNAKISRMSHSEASPKVEIPSSRHISSSQPQQLSTPLIYDVQDGEANFSAYLRYDTRCRTYGWVNFSSVSPADYSLKTDYGMTAGKSPILTAATFVGDELYAYETTYYTNVLMPAGISVIDPTTGSIMRKVTFDENADYLILDEMTYDPKTQTLFGMHYDTDAYTTDLYTINTTTFQITKVATLDQPLFTLAADDGWLYGVTMGKNSAASSLVKIDQNSIDATKQTCTVQRVSPASGTGVSIGNYSQSMDFDKTTHRLWWMAQGDDDEAYWVELDATKGTALSKVKVAGSPQFLALSTPYQYVSDKAPSYVRQLQGVAGVDGALSATLSWVNPTLDYRNNALTSLSSVNIYRNGDKVATLNPAIAGQSMEWTDEGMADGLYTYRIVPQNEAGEGVYKEVQLFVGEDIPGAPTQVRLTANGDQGTLTWQAPTQGANGGHFDASSLRYDIVRLPDNVTVTQGITQYTFTDKVEAYAGYSYMVTAINDKGRGASATSNTVPYGVCYTIPFISSLDTQADFNQWTVIDANKDGYTWAYNVYNATALYDRGEETANDWLISPPLLLDDSKQYQVRYTYYTANWFDPSSYKPVTERMRVYYGTQPTTEGLSVLLNNIVDFHTSSNEFLYGKDFFMPDELGVGYIAFQAYSEADRGQIYLKNFSVREYSSTDLSAQELTGSATANKNVSQTMTVTICNEGKAAVSDYTVQIINAETGEVLAQTQGVEVEPNATVDVPVTWTPLAEGVIQVQGKVVLHGDTYPADNISPTVIAVKVESETADKWITLGNDDTYGWNVPFYLSTRYAQVQCIFLEKEMQKKGIDITAMQFIYNGCMDGSYTFPARISMKVTDRDNLLRTASDLYTGTFEEDGWTTVFEGDVTIQGQAKDTEVIIPLDKSFHYDGGNVNVKFESLLRDDVLSTSNHPEWHFTEVSGNARTAFFRARTDVINSDDIYTYNDLPFMRVSYTEDKGSGIFTAKDQDMGVTQFGSMLYLSQSCEEADIYALSGRKVLSHRSVSKIDASGLDTGVYLLVMKAHGKQATAKIVITQAK